MLLLPALVVIALVVSMGAAVLISTARVASLGASRQIGVGPAGRATTSARSRRV